MTKFGCLVPVINSETTKLGCFSDLLRASIIKKLKQPYLVLRAKIGCFCFFTMGVHYENIKMTIVGTKMPYLVVFGFYYASMALSFNF